jgi:hypothetical protein
MMERRSEIWDVKRYRRKGKNGQLGYGRKGKEADEKGKGEGRDEERDKR